MSQDEFAKLFTYMQDEFKLINKRFDEQNVKFDTLSSTVDGLAGLIRDYQQEMLMISNKVDRLEQWIHQIAQKTGIQLSYK